MNYSELNEKQVVGGTTCERPSKVSTDEKDVTSAKKRDRKTQIGLLMLDFLCGGSDAISHIDQKVVVFSNKFDFQ